VGIPNKFWFVFAYSSYISARNWLVWRCTRELHWTNISCFVTRWLLLMRRRWVSSQNFLKGSLKSRMNLHHTVVAIHNWTISNQCTARFDNVVDDGGMRIYLLPIFNKGSTGSKMNVHHTFRMTLKECVCRMQFAVPNKVIWITLVTSLFDAHQIWIGNWEAAAREPNAARVTISYLWHQIFPYLC